MTAYKENMGPRWPDNRQYEPRDIADLQNLTDCVEEIFFEILHAMTVVPLIEDVSHIRSQRGALYDRVEAIVKRAQHLPREDGSGSPPLTD